jgi:hypothetical protein
LQASFRRTTTDLSPNPFSPRRRSSSPRRHCRHDAQRLYATLTPLLLYDL